jgi:Nucleotide modification associated domain 1
MATERESVKVLRECIDLQLRKSQDYQNPNSNIVQAMHYRRGVSTIHDMISQKLLRAQSLLEVAETQGAVSANFESLEDTYKDLVNYASFAVAYIRGEMEGQDPDRDMLNRKIVRINTENAGTITRASFEDYKNAKD